MLITSKHFLLVTLFSKAHMIRCKENLEVLLWETYLLDADVDATACLTAMIAAQLFGF